MSKRPSKTIWLVWADRGSYSDRTEYAVCWYDTEAEAKATVETLHELSEAWRRKVSDADGNYGALYEQARLAIGDEQWAPYDETTYGAFALTRGPLVVAEKGSK